MTPHECNLIDGMWFRYLPCIEGAGAAMEISPGERDRRRDEGSRGAPAAIGRLLSYGSILIAAFAATGFVTHMMRADEERRVVRASELAEDAFARFVSEGEIVRPGGIEGPEEDLVVPPGGRERYSRIVSVDPAKVGDGRARVTVTVQWETLTGRSRVKMSRLLEVREAPGP
jgi:hypothetical protein